MSVPASQALTVSLYVLKQKLRRKKRYPLVLMLEPLFRCNLACAGCGKIQYPPQLLKKSMPVEHALAAADECGAPMVSIAGGEPLMHPEIGEIAAGLVERKKYVYLCTNAILLEQRLEEGIFTPSDYFSFSVHLTASKRTTTKRSAVTGSTTRPSPAFAPPSTAASASPPIRRCSTMPTLCESATSSTR